MSLKFRILLLPSMAFLGAMLFSGCAKEAEPTIETPTTPDKKTEAPNTARPEPTAKGNTAIGEAVKIGIVASLSGDQKPWGDDSVRGAQLAVEEVNKTGGINGKKIELITGDSSSKPEQGKSAAEKLISDGVVALLGEVASGITLQMGKSAFEKGIPVIAIGATKDEVTTLGSNIFRVCYVDSFQGPVMAEFAYKERGVRNVAIITDKKLPYSTGLSNTFRPHFTKLGGKIVAEEFYEQGQTDFKAQLTNIKAKNPDGLFLSGYFPEVGPLVRQARELGITAQIFGGDGWDSKEIINSGGPGIVGAFFCNHYNDKDERPEVQEFLKKYNEKYKSNPGTTMGALGYDAAMVIIDALKRSKEANSSELIKAIEGTENLKGVSGDITLKGMGGNPPKRALVVEVQKEGFVFRKAYEPKDLTK